ncbi:jg22509 [Pararge aegeria aegeria]|uniref:Jg22509 protein n=1 Tax=Pararge aegeria aegeria TaxID=348720 RepID=A0A8S4QR99_9NEOP|nr:jg22509 [Pararge aegeria aegeria]
MSVLSLVPEEKRKELRNSLESVYSSNSRLTLLQKRKRLNPLVDMSNQSLNKGDRYVTQRVLSAKTHRVKQLQNQLADAHYHLQELSNENRVLRALQKKQEIALQRYENSNAELPQVLNSHNEEMRIQQSKFKQLKLQYRDAAQKLKERDLQLQQLKDEHQHLLDLSKDRLRSGHYPSNKFAFVMKKASSANCDICGTMDDVQHVLVECSRYNLERLDVMRRYNINRLDVGALTSLLSQPTTEGFRNLLEREKLQAQVAELTSKVQQQNEAISMLQRRIALEAKNHKHQLQAEINKHKDTRHDLDLAINNADKLSTIIEIMHLEQSLLTKLCENSRNVSSSLSHEEDTSSSTEPRSRYVSSRSSTSNRTTPSQSQNRKGSKSSDDMIELAKTVQDGMADLAIIDDDLKHATPEEMQKKMEAMKADLMKRIKNNEEPGSRKTSALRRKSTEDSIEEQIEEVVIERPKSRGRRGSTVSFYDSSSSEMNAASSSTGDEAKSMIRRELSITEKKVMGKPIEKYCKDIIQDIEKSSKVIDNHMKQFTQTKFASDKLVEQLQAVDSLNEFVNGGGDIPSEALSELNDNFKMITEQVFSDNVPIPRKRSVSGRRNSRIESRTSLLGDSNMSNQDLLEDLLGKK